MNETERKLIFYAADRKAWREWLAEHFETERDVWFVFPTKASGEESVSYNDAVEEALCFGWIDSTTGKLDETHGIRRFCPRRLGSGYSRPNIERLIRLDRLDLIHPSVRPSLEKLITTPYEFPEDLLNEIRKKTRAWENYCKFPAPYRRIRVAYIDAARRRPEEFRRRLESFLAKTEQNKIIVGFGGIDRYYTEEEPGEENNACPVTLNHRKEGE